MDDIIYFELNNWMPGVDYPYAEPFLTWMKSDLELRLANEEWCKENKICVLIDTIDMSFCFLVTATRAWVEENCPKLLTDGECGWYSIMAEYDKEQDKIVDKKVYHPCRYSKFVCKPDEDGEVRGWLGGWKFLEYKEENFGVQWAEYKEEGE